MQELSLTFRHINRQQLARAVDQTFPSSFEVDPDGLPTVLRTLVTCPHLCIHIQS